MLKQTRRQTIYYLARLFSIVAIIMLEGSFAFKWAANWGDSFNITFTPVSAVDTTAPRRITDLVAMPDETEEGKIVLSWTAPKEDGATGGAVTTYWVKYASSNLSELLGDTTAWWNQANDVPDEPWPAKNPNEKETMNIIGLTPGTTYYFAIKSRDEVPNVSEISNFASTWAEDLAPSVPQGFTVTAGDELATLFWNANPAEPDIKEYRIYRDSIPPEDVYHLLASTTGTRFIDRGLVNCNTYWYRISAVDNTNHESDKTASISAYPQDLVKPAAVTTLEAWKIKSDKVKLTWVAPGDDGYTKNIVGGLYQLRNATYPITANNWENILNTSQWSADIVASTTEVRVVNDLNSGTTYWFALRTADEAGNWSDISNIPCVQTLYDIHSVDNKINIYADIPDLTITEVSMTSPTLSVALTKATTQELNLVSSIYQFGPEGTKFDPPVELVFGYDQGSVINPNDLAILRWNGTEWSTATIVSQVIYADKDPRVVAQITSFSYYGIFIVNRLAKFILAAPSGKSTLRKTFDVQIIAVDNSGNTWTNYQGTVKIFASPAGVEFSLKESPGVMVSGYKYTLDDRGQKVLEAKALISGEVKIYAQDINNPAKSGFFTNQIEEAKKPWDIDNDEEIEYAVNRDLDLTNGFEVFEDPGGKIFSVCIATVDANGDGRIDHLIDINTDGLPDKYWDSYGDDSGDIVTSIKNMDIGEGKIISLIDINRDGNHEKYYDYTDKKIKDYKDDFDEDGLPNEWEVKYKLNPFDAQDAQFDMDGDGLNNSYECNKSKTSPLDPDSDKGGVTDGREIADATVPTNSADDKKTEQTFSPDGDGIDDIFVIPYAVSEKSSLSVKIYNSKSELVKDIPLDNQWYCYWNGKDNGGKAVPSGIYQFVVKKDGKIVIEGSLIVLAPAGEITNLKYGPQPFNPERGNHLKEKFNLYYDPTNAEIEIKIYSISGELVCDLSKENITNKKAEWAGDNDYGETVASGVYIMLIRAKNGYSGQMQVIRLKIVVLRR